MILILLGRSGCGKTAIARKLKERHGYIQVKTCTTRDRRDGEAEDAYHFMTDKEFRRHVAVDDFAEFDTYGGHLYGTLKSSLSNPEEKYICVVTPPGAEAIKEAFPDTFIVYVETDMKTSVMRSIAREKELDPGKLHKLYVRACQDHLLFDHPACDFIFPNPDGTNLEDAAKTCADEHLRYFLNFAVHDATDTVKDCIMELKAYNEKHAEENKKGD